MKNEDWEIIHNKEMTYVKRLKIDHGYIYSIRSFDDQFNAIFVPSPSIEDFSSHIKDAYNQGFEAGKKEALRQSQKMPYCIHGINGYCSKCD